MAGSIDIHGLDVSYSGKRVVKDVTMNIPEGMVTAIIGPSGCGKTTLLRCLNRLSECTDGCRVDGVIKLDGRDIYEIDPLILRRRVGMVFQRPNPFPKSIKENVLYGVRANKLKLDNNAVLRSSLEKAALWGEVENRLNSNAYNLSLGQQQRLCMARCLAISPEVLLMDEPASSLDPLSTAKIEAGIISMRGEYTIVIVTHNMQQAHRISDYTAFMYLGELIEAGETKQIFESPRKEETRAYVEGRFG